MGTIAFLLDFEEGHFLSTFKLARDLRQRGHRLCYLGLPRAESMVRQQGFEFIPILSDLAASAAASAAAGEKMTLDWLAPMVRGEVLDEVMERLQPDAFLVLSLYYPEALVIHCRYRTPIVFLTPQCRTQVRGPWIEGQMIKRLNGLRSTTLQALVDLVASLGRPLRSFKDVSQIILPLPELIFLPAEFELPELRDDPDVIYVGPSVDLTRAEEPFSWEAVDPGRFLVFASLGSQSHLEPLLARRLFQSAVAAAARHPEWQLILSIGRGHSADGFGQLPPNVQVSSWVPQLEVLSRADLMITHCGTGTCKECILLGVPMVALPMMRDQFDMARRVVHHGLGVEGVLAEITPEILETLIGRVAADRSYKERILAMRDTFMTTNGSDKAIEIVERAMTSVPAMPQPAAASWQKAGAMR
ncbi:MAG: hypothetical protein M3O15_13240 [Acidobacteriota bacterium]|nr:hypothetical protein [Acidobacteriota bacterium]